MSDNKFAIAILILLLSFFPSRAQQSAKEGMQVKYLYDTLRFEDAIKSGRDLLQEKQVLGKANLIIIHQYMAYSFFNLNKLDSARVHFLTLLSLNRNIKLDPIRTSPKIIDFFQRVRQDFNHMEREERLIPVREYVFEKDPRPSAAWRSVLLPGWGQYFKKQPDRAYWIGGIFMGSAVLTTLSFFQENKYKNLYHKETNPVQIPGLYDTYNTWSKYRRVMSYITLSAWVLSFADALWSDYPHFTLETASGGTASLSFQVAF